MNRALSIYKPSLLPRRGAPWLAERLFVGRRWLVRCGTLSAADLHTSSRGDVTTFCPTVPTLIGCLSSAFMDTVGAMTRHSNWLRKKSAFFTFYIHWSFSFLIMPPICIGLILILMLLLFQGVWLCRYSVGIMSSNNDSLKWVRHVQPLCNMHSLRAQCYIRWTGLTVQYEEFKTGRLISECTHFQLWLNTSNLKCKIKL